MMIPTREQFQQYAAALERYVEWHGAIHDEECPADDTCDCSSKWVNDGINRLVSYLRRAARVDLTI